MLVLHRICITGLATEGSLATATALHPQQIAVALRLLETMGLARRIKGKVDGVVVTPDGQCAHEALLRTSLYPVPVEEELYSRFSFVNDRFKSVCTAWQIRPDGELNDHSDDAYDQSVLAEFWVIHDAATLILRDLAEIARHLERYEGRLNEAADRLAQGDHSALLVPRSNSYHDIWMELHQDLRLAVAAH